MGFLETVKNRDMSKAQQEGQHQVTSAFDAIFTARATVSYGLRLPLRWGHQSHVGAFRDD